MRQEAGAAGREEGAIAMLEIIGRIGIGSPITVHFDRMAVHGKYRGLNVNTIVVENGKGVYYIRLNAVAAIELPLEAKPTVAGRGGKGRRRRPARRLLAAD